MQFTVCREDLLRPLGLVSGALIGRPANPILSHVLLKAEGQTLSMTGTDLEVEMVAMVNVQVTIPGLITVPARKLLDICRALPAQAMLELCLKDERLTLRSGRSRCMLNTLPAQDFPSSGTLEASLEFNMPQAEFLRLIEATQFSMANQDVRYYLNGLSFETDQQGIRTVGADGHRLATCRRECLSTPLGAQQVILPRKAVSELARLLTNDAGTLTIQMGQNNFRVIFEHFFFTTKLIDGRFPDYQRTLPQTPDKTLIVPRETLKQAFARAAILSNEKFRGVRMTLSQSSLCITANNPEKEEAEEWLDAIDYQGPDLEIGFNVSYILDVLNALKSEHIKMSLTDATCSVAIEAHPPSDVVYVVMPMRL